MDSQTITKLIRHEIWPALRHQGFSKFEGRSAFRYRKSMIHVINFQSFNSDLAGGLGCTTFSFALNLGVYIAGDLPDQQVRRDEQGRLLPYEYQCGFRARLEKRSTIDGFKRADIFFVDPDGHTTAACIGEARFLLTEIAKTWFDLFDDLDRVVSWLETSSVLPKLSPYIKGGPSGNRGSAVWCQTLSTIKLLQYCSHPNAESRKSLLDSTYKLFGAYLNQPILPSSSASVVRVQADLIRSLLGDASSPLLGTPQFKIQEDLKSVAREHFWPFLKQRGFSEFKTRSALRTLGQVIQIIEVAPPSSVDRKLSKTSGGSLSIQLGLFWPLLPVGRLGGTTSPVKTYHCQITTWALAPPSAPASIQPVLDCLEQYCLPWFSLFEDAESAMSLLQKSDAEIFKIMPMARNIGAEGSAKRLLLLSFFAYLCHRKHHARDCLEQAAYAIEHNLASNFRRNYTAWYRHLQSLILA